MKLNFIKTALFLILLVSTTICLSQNKFKINNNGLNGFYSGVVQSKNFSKPRMTHIYICEYVNSLGNSKFFCQITQYQGKKAFGSSKTTYYIGEAIKAADNTFQLGSIVNLDYKGNTHEIKDLKLLSNQEAEIISNDKYYALNTISGLYKRQEATASNFDGFLSTVYSKLLERTRRPGQPENEIVWGTKLANTGKRYGSVKQSGIKLFTKMNEIPELYNAEVIDMFYEYDDKTSDKSSINTVSIWLTDILKFKYQSKMNPLIYHFPNLKTINVINPITGLVTHQIQVAHSFYGLNFDVKPTDEGLKIREEEEFNIAEIKRRKIENEQSKVQRLNQQKEDKDKSDALAAKYNPSNEVLRLDMSSKGKRNGIQNALFGKEFMDMFNQYTESVTRDYEDKGLIEIIDADQYFKNIFYGNFDKLKPELVSRNVLGSKDYFPEFYNAFLFYAHNKYGKSYYPNMVSKEFEIITTEKTINGLGIETHRSETTTPYKIYIPKPYLAKFNQYLNKNQFSMSGEKFLVDFEYLILSFLNTYTADSLPFIQMMQNLYRFSYGKSPISKKDELIKF